MTYLWNNTNETEWCVNTNRPLIQLLDYSENGLTMKINTRICSLDDCDRKHKGRGYCKLHLQRIWRQGDPNTVGIPHSGLGSKHHNWSGDKVSYRGAHLRIARRRGRATEHLCLCGSQAAHWAYNNADINEKTTADGRRYSANPDNYFPLCVPCHSRFDAEARL